GRAHRACLQRDVLEGPAGRPVPGWRAAGGVRGRRSGGVGHHEEQAVGREHYSPPVETASVTDNGRTSRGTLPARARRRRTLSPLGRAVGVGWRQTEDGIWVWVLGCGAIAGRRGGPRSRRSPGSGWGWTCTERSISSLAAAQPRTGRRSGGGRRT